tara:strand:+ start:293 stop:745 length:453 start_codon:yes stop_codon:yes gene_type:complete
MKPKLVNETLNIKTKKVFFLSFILFFFSCEKQNRFPNVYVNISIPVTMPEFSNLTIPYGYEYINGGLGGIIVLKDIDSGFIAYDRSCTHEQNADCILSGESTIYDAILKCNNCCQSKFIVIDGSVTEGPANQALKRYNTYFDGDILYITN